MISSLIPSWSDITRSTGLGILLQPRECLLWDTAVVEKQLHFILWGLARGQWLLPKRFSVFLDFSFSGHLARERERAGFFFFLAVLGLRFCVRAFCSCGKWGPLFIAVHRPLTIVASLVAEHRLQTHRLSSCGSRAQLLHGMWDLPRPGLEPMSPALAGRFSTTAPPGKP